MDIRSLFQQTMSSAKNLFTFRTQKKIFTKLARYNFFNKHIQTKSLLYGKQMSTKVTVIFSKLASFAKNICSKIIKLLSQVGSFFKDSYINFRALPSLFLVFFSLTVVLGFCAHTYFKYQSFDALENIPAIKLLESRLTQTENQLRYAQAQLQAMSSLENEIKRTASKLGETEESLKPIKAIEERLAQAEHRVEEIDALGESLKLTGLKSLISKNKQKASHKIKNLVGQSSDLESVKEKIRKEVKRQMKELEAGDSNSF